MTCLKCLPQLQELHLSHTEVTDAGLEHLKGLRQLQTLDLRRYQGHRRWYGAPQGFGPTPGAGPQRRQDHRRRSGTPHRRCGNCKLGLSGTKVTDTGLEHLRGLPELEELCFWATGAGLKHPGVCPDSENSTSAAPRSLTPAWSTSRGYGNSNRWASAAPRSAMPAWSTSRGCDNSERWTSVYQGQGALGPDRVEVAKPAVLGPGCRSRGSLARATAQRLPEGGQSQQHAADENKSHCRGFWNRSDGERCGSRTSQPKKRGIWRTTNADSALTVESQ